MAKKAKSHAKLVKELDAVYSRYLRHKHADFSGYVQCYTCGTKKPIKEMQCGHFQSRRSMSTRFHLNNTRPQCVKCNMFSQGEQLLFYKHLCQEIGEKATEEVILLAKTSIKFSREELMEMIADYKNKLKQLEQ